MTQLYAWHRAWKRLKLMLRSSRMTTCQLLLTTLTLLDISKQGKCVIAVVEMTMHQLLVDTKISLATSAKKQDIWPKFVRAQRKASCLLRTNLHNSEVSIKLLVIVILPKRDRTLFGNQVLRNWKCSKLTRNHHAP